MIRRALLTGLAALLLVIAILALAVLFLLLRPSPVSGDAAAFGTWLDETIPALQDRYAVPAVAVALVDAGGVIFNAGYGPDAAGNPVSAGSHFQIASVSKPLAAWGVMSLVDDGALDLDAPVSTYLTRWQLPGSAYDADGVTVRRLLSHTAGLSVSGYVGFPPGQPLQTLTESLDNALDSERGEAGTPVEVVYQPGSTYRYSGGGYTVLQLLIEEVSGQPFADFMQDAVFTPLGLDATGYEPVDGLVPVYGFDGQPAPARQFTALAAGGAYSTAADMAGWVQAWLNPQVNPVFSTAAWNAMTTPQPNAERGPLQTYGLGYELDDTIRSQTQVVFHPGSNPPGWRTYAGAIPAHNTGLVVLTSSPEGSTLYNDLVCGWVRWAAADMTVPCLLRDLEASIPVIALIALASVVVLVVVLWRRRAPTG